LVDFCKIISPTEKNLVAISQVELKVHSSCHETTQQASTAPATRFQSDKHNLMKLIKHHI
jgi:hypothetical protein